MLPPAIHEKFVQVLAHRLALPEFEQWVYNTPELESALAPDDYLELISFNYYQRDALRLLEPLLVRYVSWGEVQREELLMYLQAIAGRTSAAAVLDAFQATYDLYCRGCSFLHDVALSAGLEVSCYWHEDEAAWAHLTEAQKWEYLWHFFPASPHEAERIIGWLQSGQIRFEGEMDPWYITYVDSRPTAPPAGPEPDAPSADPWPPRPRWWRFWQKRR